MWVFTTSFLEDKKSDFLYHRYPLKFQEHILMSLDIVTKLLTTPPETNF